MATRRITHVRRDISGNTTHIRWGGSTVPINTAISHIKNGTHSYYTNEKGQRTDVLVKGSGPSKYLTTQADGYSRNNLDNLPSF